VTVIARLRRRVRPPGSFSARTELARRDALTVGVRTYAARTSLIKTWSPSEQIEIGSWCSIAGEVRLVHPGASETFVDRGGREVSLRLRGNHRPETATTFPIGIALPDRPFDEIPGDGSLRSRPLVIGSDVWIGFRATVMGPATIGHGAIIGAGAVVAGDVAPYAVVAGNPARVLRMRFPQEIVDGLLAIAWWEWPETEVIAQGEWFLRPAAEFVQRFGGAGRGR
jgi:acetyltransferase-like isoleucine patch superfamily enzyme